MKGFLHEIGQEKYFEFVAFGLAEHASKMKPGVILAFLATAVAVYTPLVA